MNPAGMLAKCRPIFLFLSLICATVSPADAQAGEIWCVAKNNAETAALQSALDWACGQGGADCRPIQSGGDCFEKANLPRMASFAFNDYFTKHGFTDESCNFSNTAAVTSLNPSYNKCKFPSSLSRGNGKFNSSGTANSSDLSSSSGSILINWNSFVSTTIFMLFAIAYMLGR